MAALTTDDFAAIAARHPEVFTASRRKTLLGSALALAVIAYLIFAWWFFSLGAVVANGRWDIAGSYLADWVSYESRPDIAFEDGYLEVTFPRFDPMGENPDPDWLTTETTSVERAARSGSSETISGGGASSSVDSFLGTIGGAPAPSGTAGGTAASASGAEGKHADPVSSEEVVRAVVRLDGAVVEIEPGRVKITRGGESLVADILRNESVIASGELPVWVRQRGPGDRIVAEFGFAGRVEIEDDEVKVRHRFLGWENFLFDAYSPFWGKPAGEMLSLIASGERIDPARSNLALAWNNILYNAEWQHLDVWTKLLQTIVMAFVGTVLASLLAFPLAFAAARNITPNRVANQALKRFFDFLRSVDMLIWALFFTRAFGPGPLAGISAIFFTDTGTLGKLYSEALENIDDRQREGIRSVGAAPSVVQRFGVVPQVLPVFLSQSLYFWESNTRSATIIGAVGAGGIGLKLWEAMRTNSDWENVAYMVILILIVVFIFDAISNALRSRLMGRQT
jgi:phosphonate transport system permease protein